MIGQDQGQRTGNQAGDTVGVDMDGIAQAQFDVEQNFAPERIQHHVLRGGEEGYRSSQIGDGPDIKRRIEPAEQRERQQQRHLGQ